MSELYEMSVQKLTEKLEKAEKELAVAVIENADLRERLSSLENLYRARDKDCAAKEAELERVRAALEEEEHSHAKTIDDRDSYHDQADALAMAISELTGVDIGEHSSANNPWAEALVAIDEYKAALASPASSPVECQQCAVKDAELERVHGILKAAQSRSDWGCGACEMYQGVADTLAAYRKQGGEQ